MVLMLVSRTVFVFPSCSLMQTLSKQYYASAAGRVNKVSLLATSHIFHLTGVNVYMKCCLNKLAQ